MSRKKEKKLGMKRILRGKLSFTNWLNTFGGDCFKWYQISFDTFWGGRIFHLRIGKFQFELDCRYSWVEDMITGKIK